MSAAERVKGAAMEQECKYLRARIEQLERELAAETALADRLAVALNAVWRFTTKSPDYEAYRKARGL